VAAACSLRPGGKFSESEDEARRMRRKARQARSSTRGPCCFSSDSFYLGLAVTWAVGPALHFTWATNITVQINQNASLGHESGNAGRRLDPDS
jgi:hypothetical protein